MQATTLQKVNTHQILGFYEAKLCSEKELQDEFIFFFFRENGRGRVVPFFFFKCKHWYIYFQMLERNITLQQKY